MHLVERRKAGKEGAMWRCPRRGCRKEVSLRKGTFFEGISFDDLCVMYYIFILAVGSNLEIKKILRILHLWSTKTPLNKMMAEVEVHASV